MPNRNKSNRYFYIAVVLFFFILSLMLTRQLDPLFNDASHRIGPGTDFWAYYNAGIYAFSEEGMYDRGPGMGYRYHPLTAIAVFAQFSRLEYDPAYYLWLGINSFILVLLLYLITVHIRKPDIMLYALGITVLFSPLYLELYMGNSHLLAGMLLLFSLLFYRGGKKVLFAIVFLLSLFIKPIGLVFLPALVIKKEYRIAGITFGIFLLSALPYFFWQSDAWGRFVAINLTYAGSEPGFIVHGGNQGLLSFMTALAAHSSGVTLRSLGGLSELASGWRVFLEAFPFLVVGAAGYLSYCLRKQVSLLSISAIWLSVYLLGYKDIWEHSYVIVLIMGMLFMLDNWRFTKVSGMSLLFLALPTLFVLYDLVLPDSGFFDPDWYWTISVSLLHHATKPMLLLLFLFSLKPPQLSAPVNH